MKIRCIGGGPAGLYFAILMKKLDPGLDIAVYERNRADDTFGWGVVFSAATLGNLAEADPESYQAIADAFIYWDDIDTHYRGEVITTTGHGFCGLSRKRLLLLLQERCRSLGLPLHFEQEVAGPEDFPDADLVVAADGVNSRVREAHAAAFEPSLDWRACRFTWLGTDRPMRAFTFLIAEHPDGVWQAHAYPFEAGLGTFIVEGREETWRRAGLEEAGEAETIAYCEALFADWLGGHRLMGNRSIWRRFPTVRCARWHHGNTVLLGDAAHTAHFSIGSGTKLAMESAIVLADSFQRFRMASGRWPRRAEVPALLADYDAARRVDVVKTQKAAQTSLEWFENTARYLAQPPLQLTFNLMSRSKQITWDNMAQRDPGFVEAVRAWYAADVGMRPARDGRVPEPMFAPFELRGLRLANRVVVSPMCQYVAEDGLPNDWHLVHLGSRAVGGAGLVIAEMTDVSAEARISPGCAGMYRPEHAEAWRRVVDFVHRWSAARICLQLGHAGRKGSTRVPWAEGGDEMPLESGNWPLLAPSAIPYQPHRQVPKAMDRADMDAVIADFLRAAAWADEAGFDMLELHMAHGYLLGSFISPLTNRRSDAYGGALGARMRFPLEVFDAVRAAWPADKPMSVRISATDWVADGGLDGADAVAVARLLQAAGCDIVDVSAGQTVPYASPDYGRMFQVPFSDRIRHATGMPTMAVGAILGADHINTILAAGRADLCALARPHLRDPYLTLHAAERYGHYDQAWPEPYLTVRPRPRDEAGASRDVAEAAALIRSASRAIPSSGREAESTPPHPRPGSTPNEETKVARRSPPLQPAR